MNDIEEALASTLTRRAESVPVPIGLTEKVRRRHAEERRRRTLVTAVSGIAAATLVAAGVSVVDLPTSGNGPAGISAAASGPSDPVGTDPTKTDPPPTESPVKPTPVEPDLPADRVPGALLWPTRGSDEPTGAGLDKLRAMWAEVPGTNLVRTGKDVAPLGESPRLINVLYIADAPTSNVIVMQGTDETKQAMLAVFQIMDGPENQEHRLLSRGPVDGYRLSPSSDVVRFVVDDDVYLLTPPSATAAVSRTPVSGGTRAFTPVPLEDGMFTAPLEGGTQEQVRVRVGSKTVYQGPISPD